VKHRSKLIIAYAAHFFITVLLGIALGWFMDIKEHVVLFIAIAAIIALFIERIPKYLLRRLK